MQNDISVAALCLKLEQKLMEVWNNELTLERYRKVLAEFTVLQVTAVTASRLTLIFCGCLQNTTTLALSTDGMIFLVKSSGQGHSVNVQKGFLRPS